MNGTTLLPHTEGEKTPWKLVKSSVLTFNFFNHKSNIIKLGGGDFLGTSFSGSLKIGS